MTRLARGPAIALISVLISMPSFAGGDAAAGKKVFTRCMACHDATSEQDRVGPHLLGVIGRAAGSAPSYLSRYSQAMKDAGGGGLVWSEATLTDYLRAPKAKVPGNKMGFAGLKDDADIANVIAYLKADPKP